MPIRNQYKRPSPTYQIMKETNTEIDFKELPIVFEDEKIVLLSIGITSWSTLKKLSEGDLSQITRKHRISINKLKRLQCISLFITELDLNQKDAFILLHSGIPSIKSLSTLTPQELIQKTGRLERMLNTRRQPVVNIKSAQKWISKAKEAHGIKNL